MNDDKETPENAKHDVSDTYQNDLGPSDKPTTDLRDSNWYSCPIHGPYSAAAGRCPSC